VEQAPRELDELCGNTLLAALPEVEFDRLSRCLEVVDVQLRDGVYQPRQPISEVYFPLTAVFSMVAVADDRLTVEVGTVGYEGMVGLPLFLGASTSPNAAFCQIPGGRSGWVQQICTSSSATTGRSIACCSGSPRPRWCSSRRTSPAT